MSFNSWELLFFGGWMFMFGGVILPALACIFFKWKIDLKIITGGALLILAMIITGLVAWGIVAASTFTGENAVKDATEIFKTVASFLTPLGAALVAWIGWKNYLATVKKKKQEAKKHAHDVRIAETRRLDELFVKGLELFNDRKLHNHNIGFSLLEKIGLESKYYSNTIVKLFCDYIEKESKYSHQQYINTNGQNTNPSNQAINIEIKDLNIGINLNNIFKSVLTIRQKHKIYEIISFSKLRLSDITVDRLNIHSISFNSCLINNFSLSKLDIVNSFFNNCDMKSCQFNELKFQNTDFNFCSIQESKFIGVNFENTKIKSSREISDLTFS